LFSLQTAYSARPWEIFAAVFMAQDSLSVFHSAVLLLNANGETHGWSRLSSARSESGNQVADFQARTHCVVRE
jgi:hypothetical protein